jgi:hypothetical protein
MENGVCQEKPRERYIQGPAMTHHTEVRKPHPPNCLLTTPSFPHTLGGILFFFSRIQWIDS